MINERRLFLSGASSRTIGMSANEIDRAIGKESNLKDKFAKKNGFAPKGRAARAAIKGRLI